LSEAPPLIERLETFEDRFRQACGAPLERRLGLVGGDAERGWRLRVAIDEALVATQVPIDRFFHDARGGVLSAGYGSEWDKLRDVLSDYEPIAGARSHPHFAQDQPCSMLIDEVEAIWSAIDRDDDWGPFHAKVAAIRAFGDALDSAQR
jgi:hypothetical protein